jgi:hypothetical protein
VEPAQQLAGVLLAAAMRCWWASASVWNSSRIGLELGGGTSPSCGDLDGELLDLVLVEVGEHLRGALGPTASITAAAFCARPRTRRAGHRRHRPVGEPAAQQRGDLLGLAFDQLGDLVLDGSGPVAASGRLLGGSSALRSGRTWAGHDLLLRLGGRRRAAAHQEQPDAMASRPQRDDPLDQSSTRSRAVLLDGSSAAGGVATRVIAIWSPRSASMPAAAPPARAARRRLPTARLVDDQRDRQLLDGARGLHGAGGGAVDAELAGGLVALVGALAVVGPAAGHRRPRRSRRPPAGRCPRSVPRWSARAARRRRSS